MSRFSMLLLLLATLPLPLARAGLNVMSDSLSDAGNVSLWSGGAEGPLFSPTPLDPSDPGYNPLLPIPRFPTPPYSGGSAADGPLWIEQLAEILGEDVPTASLAGGTNYAWIAAASGPQVTSFFGSPDMQMQVQSYLADLGSDTPAPDDLFVVWGGANDYLQGGTDPATTVANLATIITDLHAAGGRRFLVPNIPRLGETPQGRIVNREGLNWLSNTHNILLADELDSLRSTLDAVIVEVDVASLFDDILASPGDYGLTNTTGTALSLIDDPSSPLFFFPEYPVSVAANSHEYLFFDGVHPTSVVHGFIAEAAAQVLDIVPEPSALPLLASLVAGQWLWLAPTRRRQRAWNN